MALTKVSGGIIQQPIDVGIITATSINASGIVTAGTVQVGSATTIHSTGIDLGSGNITSHNINSTGIVTATSFVGPVTGNADTASNLTGSPSITVTDITASGNVTVGAGLSVVGISTLSNTVVGGATTELVVTGASYITNDLDVGGIVSSEESAIVMNPNAISRNTTVPANYNARTIGPTITINDGVSVTISSNGEWTITK